MLSHKDYNLIAKALNRVHREHLLDTGRDRFARITIGRVFDVLFPELQKDNPKFDYSKFHNAVFDIT